MRNCIKDLYDYDLIKKCSKCKIISLKSNFHKIKTEKMVYNHISNFVGTFIEKNIMKNILI